MASFFDISLLGNFSDIFVILFVFTAAYAILMLKKPFGDFKGVNALLAFAMAMMFIFSQDAIQIIKNTVPWYIILMIALTMTLMVTKSIGGEMPARLMSDIGTWILVIGVIILVINISMSIGQDVGPFLSNETINPDSVTAGGSGDVGSGSFAQNFGATLFHPKVLAMLVVLITALFAVLLVGYWI